jgi:hypothetical protein
MNPMKKRVSPLLRCALAILALTQLAPALAIDPLNPGRKFNDFWEDEKEWKEAEIEPPAFPADANLVPIYVSAVATNQYLIDKASLAVGGDGVVRYTLVVRTPGGAQNISFEGMRCETREWKTYATGRVTPEGSVWSKARMNQWRPVENKPVNRHHAAISKDFFCPMGNPIYTADEGRDALRRGGHPSVPGVGK